MKLLQSERTDATRERKLTVLISTLFIAFNIRPRQRPITARFVMKKIQARKRAFSGVMRSKSICVNHARIIEIRDNSETDSRKTFYASCSYDFLNKKFNLVHEIPENHRNSICILSS